MDDDETDEGYEPEIAPIRVLVWYELVPDLANPLLVDVLEQSIEHVTADGGMIRVEHPSLLGATDDGDPRWGFSVLSAAPGEGLPSAQGVRDWPGAAEALARCRGAIAVDEELPGAVEPGRRMFAIRRLLGALVEATAPLAFSWPGSEAVTEPAATVSGDDASGFVHVRQQPSDEDPSGLLMDTLGMAAFDLPDLECHFRGLDPELVAGQLFDHANRILEASEFIADGDPVMASDSVWFTARYSWAREPERRVVALVPDSEHALGGPPPDPLEGLDGDD